MEKHDHPTSRQRLGDLEAGLGSAATMTFDDAEAIGNCGCPVRRGGIHETSASTRPFEQAQGRPERIEGGQKRWFTRMHGTDV